MFPTIKTFCNELEKEFSLIPDERKILLEKITSYIIEKREKKKAAQLVYICTHNSRRSHFGQVWAQVAATYYALDHVNAYSGGTEVTAFNINAINALKRIGFDISATTEENNPYYQVKYGDHNESVVCFSKVYSNLENPQQEFAAIMTCSEAEEHCPFVPGVELRISTTYGDPKAFDNTALQDEKYNERCRQIARETLYAFSKVKDSV